MRKREKIILNELVSEKKFITSEELSQIANVTSRTIRDDMRKIKAEIEEHGASIESHSGIGYKIIINNYKLFGEFINTLKIKEVAQYEEIPDDSNDRINYLIKKLITIDFPIKIEELMDELCVSRSTLTAELKEVRKKIGKYNLKLEQKPNYGIFIEGSEIGKRLCISEYFFHSSADKGYFAEESILFNSSVNREEIAIIKATLINVLQKYTVMISDVSLQNLVIHVIISLRRARFYNYVHFEEKQINFLKSEREYQVAKEIAQVLSSKFKEIWPESEVAYLTIHLLGKKILIQNDSDTFNTSIMAKLLVEKIIFSINEKSGVDLHNDEEFKKVLSLHLDPLLIRLKLGLINRNPMINDIKMNYTYAFSLAEVAGRVIGEEVDLTVNEDEIGYIALYIGLALEKLEKRTNKKSILLVSTMGRSSAQLQKYKILNQFNEYIERFDIIDMYQLPNVDNSKYDFMLSSVHINYKVNTPIIYVNEILKNKDMNLIQNALLRIKEEKKNIRDYLDKNLFFSDIKARNKAEAIKNFIKCISKKGAGEEEIYESISEDGAKIENFCVVMYSSIALFDEVKIALGILDKPIIWDKEIVKVMFMIFKPSGDINGLQQSTKMLFSLVKDFKKIKNIMDAKVFEDFTKS